MAETGVSQQEFALVRHNDFESLIGQLRARPISERDVIGLALDKGRVLIQGPAGVGKSLLASQIAASDGPKFVALDGSGFVEYASSAIGAASWLIDALVGVEPGFVALLDGLDAVSDEQFEWLVEAVDDYARDEPRVGFIVFDRVQRRPISLRRWALVALTGIELGQTPGSFVNWRNLALYRQLVQGRSDMTSPVEVLRTAFEDALKETHMGLRELAKAQLSTTLTVHTSPRDSLALPRVDGATVRSLVSAGLGQAGEGADAPRWRHRLVARFLEAVELAARTELWDHSTFRVLTDDGTQFDVLWYTLDLLADDKVGSFTRAVDDWSYVASGRLIAYDSRTTQRMPRDLQFALLLLMGRRQFSEVPATRTLAADILREHQSGVALEILDAGGSDQLVSLADSRQGPNSAWLLEWRALYTPPKSLSQERRQVQAISSTDGVLGWTAANTLCLQPLRPQTREELYELGADNPNETTRWRAVHALGGTPRPEVVAFALECFDSDSSRWVKYGSLRSAILVTAHLPSAAKRRDAIDELVRRTPTILETPRLLDVTESSLLVEDAPRTWLNDAGPLIESLWANSTSVAEQDRWRDLSRALRSRL